MEIYLQPRLRSSNMHYKTVSDPEGHSISAGIGEGHFQDGVEKKIPIASVVIPDLIDLTGEVMGNIRITGSGRFLKDIKRLLSNKASADEIRLATLRSLADAIFDDPMVWSDMMQQSFKAGERSGSMKARQELRNWLGGCPV